MKDTDYQTRGQGEVGSVNINADGQSPLMVGSSNGNSSGASSGWGAGANRGVVSTSQLGLHKWRRSKCEQ